MELFSFFTFQLICCYCVATLLSFVSFVFCNFTDVVDDIVELFNGDLSSLKLLAKTAIATVNLAAISSTFFLFGVAISYSDSVTMTTNICEVDSISYYKETKTPVGLDLYTESLNNYLVAQGKKGYLCSTFIFNTKKQAEKKLLYIRNKVTSKKQTALRPISDFKYVYINTDNIFTNEFVNKSSGMGNDDDF